jgi:hypothetical protein
MRGLVVIARQLPQALRHWHKGHLARGAAAIEMALVLAGVLVSSSRE